MGTIKDKNGNDPVDAEEIKKRWKEYMEEQYKQDLNELDYYDGVVSHPEPDILECEVKWALRSTAVNITSGCDEIPAELFKSPKMMPSKCHIHYVSKSGRPSSGHRIRKGQFSFQSQRKAMPKNVQTTAQLHSFHTLKK